MCKCLISKFILVVYSAILIKMMILRDIPVIKVGHLMLRFGGADANGQANFIPFKTILPYLLGYKGCIIASVNLLGNIALLVPAGFLIPLVYKNITRRKILIVAVTVPTLIELAQVLLHTGIFDIDDVILNGLGVMVGYFIFKFLQKLISKML